MILPKLLKQWLPWVFSTTKNNGDHRWFNALLHPSESNPSNLTADMSNTFIYLFSPICISPFTDLKDALHEKKIKTFEYNGVDSSISLEDKCRHAVSTVPPSCHHAGAMPTTSWCKSVQCKLCVCGGALPCEVGLLPVCWAHPKGLWVIMLQVKVLHSQEGRCEWEVLNPEGLEMAP